MRPFDEAVALRCAVLRAPHAKVSKCCVDLLWTGRGTLVTKGIILFARLSVCVAGTQSFLERASGRKSEEHSIGKVMHEASVFAIVLTHVED